MHPEKNHSLGTVLNTHTCPFNGPFSGTTQVSQTVSSSGISWAIYKSAPCYRQITTPSPHHSVFYRLDALLPPTNNNNNNNDRLTAFDPGQPG